MSNPDLIVDDREQKPYDFDSMGVDTAVERLDVGDYTYAGYRSTFAVERKSLDDLATSCGSERSRFESEIRRANGLASINEDGNPRPGTKPEHGGLDEFVVVIEAHPNEVYKYSGDGYCPNYYSKIIPNAVIGTVEKWPNKYDTLEFKWCGDREGAEQETLALLDEWLLKYKYLD